MNFKRLAAFLLAALILVSTLAACGQVSDEPLNPPENSSEPVVTLPPETTPEPVTTPEPTTTPEPVTTPEPTTTPEPVTTTEPTTSESNPDDFTVEEMSATMYATISLNVRSGPSTDFDRVGALAEGEAVTVTGRASTGWYRIEFNGKEGYVSNVYMTSDRPAQTPATTASKPKTDDDEENVDDDNHGAAPTVPSTVPSTTPTSGTVSAGDWVAENGVAYMYGLFTQDRYKNALNALGKAVQNLEPRVDLGDYLSAQECMDFASYIAEMAGTGYCYFDQISSLSGTVATLRYYASSADEAKKMVSSLNSVADKVVNTVSGYSDYNKIKYIYEYVAKNCRYDDAGPHYASGYGALVDGRATCMGYAKAAFYLLSKAGLDVVYEVGFGTEAEHIWVKVKLGGSWYCVDPGWADPQPSNNLDPSYVSYDFLLVSDDFMKNTRAAVYDLSKYYTTPRANSDSYSWYNVNNCYATSMAEAKQILKAATQDAVNNAGGKEYIYVRIQFSTLSLLREAYEHYSHSTYTSEILSQVTSKYKSNSRLTDQMNETDLKKTRSLVFRLKKN